MNKKLLGNLLLQLLTFHIISHINISLLVSLQGQQVGLRLTMDNTAMCGKVVLDRNEGRSRFVNPHFWLDIADYLLLGVILGRVGL